MDLILITSVINISDKPLSYWPVRSVFNSEQRFRDTLKTIESLYRITDKKILFVEASDLNKEYEDIIKNKVDFYINIYKDDIIKNAINSEYKCIGEPTNILEGIKNFNLNEYDNIYKISGRYWLMNEFDYNIWKNDDTIFVKNGNFGNLSTVFYKINKKQYEEWKSVLENCILDMVGVENTFQNRMKNYKLIDKIWVCGYISPDGSYIER